MCPRHLQSLLIISVHPPIIFRCGFCCLHFTDEKTKALKAGKGQRLDSNGAFLTSFITSCFLNTILGRYGPCLAGESLHMSRWVPALRPPGNIPPPSSIHPTPFAYRIKKCLQLKEEQLGLRLGLGEEKREGSATGGDPFGSHTAPSPLWERPLGQGLSFSLGVCVIS